MFNRYIAQLAALSDAQLLGLFSRLSRNEITLDNYYRASEGNNEQLLDRNYITVDAYRREFDAVIARTNRLLKQTVLSLHDMPYVSMAQINANNAEHERQEMLDKLVEEYKKLTPVQRIHYRDQFRDTLHRGMDSNPDALNDFEAIALRDTLFMIAIREMVNVFAFRVYQVKDASVFDQSQVIQELSQVGYVRFPIKNSQLSALVNNFITMQTQLFKEFTKPEKELAEEYFKMFLGWEADFRAKHYHTMGVLFTMEMFLNASLENMRNWSKSEKDVISAQTILQVIASLPHQLECTDLRDGTLPKQVEVVYKSVCEQVDKRLADKKKLEVKNRKFKFWATEKNKLEEAKPLIKHTLA